MLPEDMIRHLAEMRYAGLYAAKEGRAAFVDFGNRKKSCTPMVRFFQSGFDD
jgi:hypothetical protein